MKESTILELFIFEAKRLGLSLEGDSTRYFRLKTARAWTKFHQQHSKG